MTVYEFDALARRRSSTDAPDGLHVLPEAVYDWLEGECLRVSALGDAAWLRLGQRRGRRAIQVTSYAGVIRAPSGFQIEVLPKVGAVLSGGVAVARQLLIDMLSCLPGFRHIATPSASIAATRMPLLEVFVGEFLRTVSQLVKRGLRSEYSERVDNVFALRGKLQVAGHLRLNIARADRFFTEYDEFSADRAENRLVHSALRFVLSMTADQANQRLARELAFVFADVPLARDVRRDFQRVNIDRGMENYRDALDWARIILTEQSPLTGVGGQMAPSLLFPMEAVFEAFVAKHLAAVVKRPLRLSSQVQSGHLMRHSGSGLLRLRPDLLLRDGDLPVAALDTKWKLITEQMSAGSQSYGISPADFYQMHAYGTAYLGSTGDVVLIYPKTEVFTEALPVFEFPSAKGLRLWVLPFCLKSRRLGVPADASTLSTMGVRSAPC